VKFRFNADISDIHARAEVAERILDESALRRLATMEKKDAKRLSKVIRSEGKAEAKAVASSIKELERLVKLQKEAASAERKSQLRLTKWTSKEHKARLRFLKEKERYERIEGELRNAENDYEERRDHAGGLTSQVAEKTQDLDDLRGQKAADDVSCLHDGADGSANAKSSCSPSRTPPTVRFYNIWIYNSLSVDMKHASFQVTYPGLVQSTVVISCLHVSTDAFIDVSLYIMPPRRSKRVADAGEAADGAKRQKYDIDELALDPEPETSFTDNFVPKAGPSTARGSDERAAKAAKKARVKVEKNAIKAEAQRLKDERKRVRDEERRVKDEQKRVRAEALAKKRAAKAEQEERMSRLRTHAPASTVDRRKSRPVQS
jgi:hypothetical protein